MNYSVKFEKTPNPATLKFQASKAISQESFNCPTAQDAERSPLASKIFGFPWTSAVFIGNDFITVTKQDWVEWEVLAAPLAGLIQEHLERGEPVLVALTSAHDADEDSDSEEVKKIKMILNREIRPVVALDGGDVVFAKFEDQIVYLHMRGACAGCPSSKQTLKSGIEVRLKELMPEIKEVVSI